MTRSEYIEKIGKLVQKYCPMYGVKVASPIIAQAIVEGLYIGEETILAYKYHNYFGMKCGSDWTGKSVNLQTQEEYSVGTMTTIYDNFRVYDSMEEGVKGYFEFIEYSRYKNLHETSDPYTYICRLKEDGYATSSQYVDLLWTIVQQDGLTRFDTFSADPEKVQSADPEEVQVGRQIIIADGKPKNFSTEVYGDYVTTADYLNVRNDAGTDADILTTIPAGTNVMCNGFYTDTGENKWLHIQFYDQDGSVCLGFACDGENGERYMRSL